MPGPPLRQRLMGSWRGAGQFLGSVHYVSLLRSFVPVPDKLFCDLDHTSR